MEKYVQFDLKESAGTGQMKVVEVDVDSQDLIGIDKGDQCN